MEQMTVILNDKIFNKVKSIAEKHNISIESCVSCLVDSYVRSKIEVCECCNEEFILEDEDIISFNGPHNGCEVGGPHFHSKQPILLCYKCQKK